VTLVITSVDDDEEVTDMTVVGEAQTDATAGGPQPAEQAGPGTPAGPGVQVGPGELFIGGSWRPAVSGATEPIADPATGRPIVRVAAADGQDVSLAVAAARSAFDGGVWSGMTPRQRGKVLLKAAELLAARADEFARLESLDVGKPLMFTSTVDIPTVVDTFEYYAALTAGIGGATRPTTAPSLAYTRREAIGVVAAITPFNFPAILSATKIAPALAAGNTVVHKPAQETPLTALRFAEVLAEAGVPDGVFNVVTGDGAVGAALVEHPGVDKVAFTGSSATGRKVAALAAGTLKQVTVELGGKGANLIFADADLEAAINTAIAAFVFNTGQFCMSGSRLLVERPVYEAVVGALGGAAPHIPVGDPFAEGTVVGPMAGPAHLAKVRSFLDAAAATPGVRVLGGGEPAGPGGFFVTPTVLADVDQASTFVQDEIFGPVVTVQPFDTEEEAVRLANGTAYGLSAGLQTRDVSRAHRVAAALNAGIVWVNGWSLLDPAMPFGGVGQSGYGRENGPEGLDAYLRTKSVVVNLG
jgi:acyl-CoA reductase-like NAD-dependent aldehyde dehydrogenase